MNVRICFQCRTPTVKPLSIISVGTAEMIGKQRLQEGIWMFQKHRTCNYKHSSWATVFVNKDKVALMPVCKLLLLQRTLWLTAVYLKRYVADETIPIPSSCILFIMLSNAVHIKEWFNSFITSMYCSTTRHWFSSHLSLSSYCMLLLPPTQSSHSALMLEVPQVARQGHCLLIHKNLSWLPQGLAKSYPYGRHHLLQYWSPIQLRI
jgi:hypothetical protein